MVQYHPFAPDIDRIRVEPLVRPFSFIRESGANGPFTINKQLPEINRHLYFPATAAVFLPIGRQELSADDNWGFIHESLDGQIAAFDTEGCIQGICPSSQDDVSDPGIAIGKGDRFSQ